ncbi:MAG: PHP domain-containing protein [Gemmatimonadetes bacterium]|nr:PHP domain-containing protein [Gemmatimonadota bacterium]
MGSIDLHSHSNASDGYLSPQDLVAAAAEAGITTLALTDSAVVGRHNETATSTSTFDPAASTATEFEFTLKHAGASANTFIGFSAFAGCRSLSRNRQRQTRCHVPQVSSGSRRETSRSASHLLGTATMRYASRKPA